MSEQTTAKLSELEEWKAHAAEHGYEFSIHDFYNSIIAYEHVRKQWFPRIQFIDVHQTDAPSITDADMKFHNSGINPDFQVCNTDVFMNEI